MPCFSTSRQTFSNNSSVCGCGSPVSLCTNSGIGTPQLRWRDTHQSGRFLIIASRRARPQLGKNSVLSTALLACSRRLTPWASVSFIPMNHWWVANCINGVLWRQQCGKLWLRRALANNAPFSCILVRITLLASCLVRPRIASNSTSWLLKNLPSPPINTRGFSLGKLARITSQSSLPCAAAVCTRPVPASVVTCSPQITGTWR